MIVILNVYKTKPQVQLETQVTPVLPQQRLAKFVDDDLMLCHSGKRERDALTEGKRECANEYSPTMVTNKINRRERQLQTNQARIPQKHLSKPNRKACVVEH